MTATDYGVYLLLAGCMILVLDVIVAVVCDKPLRRSIQALRADAEKRAFDAWLAPARTTLTSMPEHPLELPGIGHTRELAARPLPSRLRVVGDVIPAGVEGVPIGTRMEADTEVIQAVIVDDSACDSPCSARHCFEHSGLPGTVAQRAPEVAEHQRVMHLAWNGDTGAFQITDAELGEVTRSWSLLDLLEVTR